jgi:N utilization substance protein A
MTDIASAIKQVCDEKGLSYEAVIVTIESALAAAYRKDFGEKNQNIKVQYDPETGKSKIFDVKTVVEDLPEETEDESTTGNSFGEDERGKEVKSPLVFGSDAKETGKDKKEKKGKQEKKEAEEKKDKEASISLGPDEGEEEREERKFNPKTEIQLSDAKLIKKTAKIGDEIKIKLAVPEGYGRMAAQTAKQVIIQRLREAEREMIFNEFKGKEKEVVSGVVQRREGRIVLVDLGKTVGILLQEDQVPGESYRPGERIKVYVREVNLKPKGPEILLSRTSEEVLKKVFYLEIPEISNGLIELKEVAREAGSRSKVAVWADSENVDPIGSCVGQRGARIQTIISELGGEKVDIIQYDEDLVKFISNALSPAKIISIEINDKNKKAIVKVTSDQLSLAIGKGGQNVRLAAKLTGWKIDILGSEEKEEDKKAEGKEADEDRKAKKQESKKTPKQSPEAEQARYRAGKLATGQTRKQKDKKTEDEDKEDKKFEKKEEDKKEEKKGEEADEDKKAKKQESKKTESEDKKEKSKDKKNKKEKESKKINLVR